MKLDPTYLYTSSRKVKDIPSVIALYKDAAALMRKKNGVGLAANQVGYNLRWFVWQHGDQWRKQPAAPKGATS